MKFKILLLLTLVFTSMPTRALAETPRPIFASSLYNGSGFLYVPTITPFGNRACYFDNNSTVASSVTTATELSYLSGATSNIQAQINAISGGSGGPRSTNVMSANFTLPTLTVDYLLNVNTTSGVVTVILGDAVGSRGWCVDIKNVGVNSVTINTTGSQTIDGVSSDSVMNQNDTKRYCAISGNWNNY